MFVFDCRCPLCEVNYILQSNWQVKDYEDFDGTCNVSGRVYITGEALEKILTDKKDMHILQGYIRSINEEREINKNIKHPSINTQNLEEIFNDSCIPRSIPQKLNTLLKNLGKYSDYGGQEIMFYYSKDYPLGYAKNEWEMEYFFDELANKKYIEIIWKSDEKGEIMVRVTQPGWEKIDEIKFGKTSEKPSVEQTRNIYTANYYEIHSDSAYISILKGSGITREQVSVLIDEIKQNQAALKSVQDLQSDDIEVLKFAVERLKPYLKKAFNKEFDTKEQKILKSLSAVVLRFIASDSIGDQITW